MDPKESGVINDLEDRDPHALSQHLQFNWPDVVGEPDSFRSPECAWRLSKQCYNGSRNCCYIFLSVLMSPLMAICTGCCFACIAFEHIWCWAPFLKTVKINCNVIRTLFRACSAAIVVPCCESLGYVFSSIKIQKQNLPDGPDHRDDILLV